MIDLKPFCSTDKTREPICLPWSVGKFTYATNASIMVRVPRRPDVLDNLKAPGAEHVARIFAEPNDGNFRELPAFTAPKKTACVNCDTTGLCECAGCGTEHECGECDGTGFVEEGLPGVRFGKQRVNPKYLALLAVLPGVLLANSPDEYGPFTFTFDGGEGRLMPMRES